MSKRKKIVAFSSMAAVLALGLVIETTIETRKPNRQTESVRPALSEGGVFAESDSILKDLENARVGESAAETLVGENETAEAVDGEELSNTKPEPETEQIGSGADTGVEGGATSNQVEPKKPENKNPGDGQTAPKPKTETEDVAGQIVANGYVDSRGMLVGPDNPETMKSPGKCNSMSSSPEFTVWYRYANGDVRYEKRRFLEPVGGLVDKTRGGVLLPYAVLFDATGVSVIDYDEETQDYVYADNPWVMCSVYPNDIGPK